MSQSPTFSIRLLDKVPSTVFNNLTDNKTFTCSFLSRHFYYHSCVADKAGDLSLPGIHKLPVIYVYGDTLDLDWTCITIIQNTIGDTGN